MKVMRRMKKYKIQNTVYKSGKCAFCDLVIDGRIHVVAVNLMSNDW